jgi:hypothetical protein
MITADLIRCWACKEYLDTNSIDGMLMCVICASPLRRPHDVLPLRIKFE